MPCRSVDSLAFEKTTAGDCGYNFGGLGSLVLWFIIIFIIVWFIMWLIKPVAVQTRNPDGTPTGNIDAGKVLVASLIVALIIVILIWLFRYMCAW